MSPHFSDLEELSASALPVVTLDTVLNSGKTIDGRVSFRRSDPATLERDVHSAVSTFIQSSTPPENVESNEN